MSLRLALVLLSAGAASGVAALPPFLEKHCVECHDADAKKGGLDLTALKSDLKDRKAFEAWVKVFDRTAAGEMPPKKKPRPDAAQKAAYLGELSALLVRQDAARIAAEGRSVERRMNRFEYENAVRDLLQAPWLDLKEILPEDTEAFRFNKSGQALDVSHVQLQRYMTAAEEGLKSAFLSSVEQPDASPKRYYARQQGSYTGKMKFSEFNQSPERATFPTLGYVGQPAVRRGDAPVTVGRSDPKLRDEEGVGVVHGSYEPVEPNFGTFRAPLDGRYLLKLCGHSVWVGPGKTKSKGVVRWQIPDLDDISKGRRPEPVTVYALTPPRVLRRIGTIDLAPDVTVAELDVVLKAGESIQIDTTRFFRSRPGASRAQNPLATPEGQPGLVMRWIEVAGPFAPQWPAAPYRAMFDDLPAKRAVGSPLRYEVETKDAPKDAERLLRRFVRQAYRSPVSAQEEVRFLPVILAAMKSGSTFAEAMLAGYTAVLCSPSYLYLREQPGRLDDHALAARLSYFLWNSPPDAELRALASAGKLRDPATLRAQTERLLADARSARFVDSFTDYWLDLRKSGANDPDNLLYPDYYLDDHLVESARDESHLTFAELLRANLPSRTVVDADFAYVNERLASLYQLPPVSGSRLRKVALPKDSVRGGFLTQAAVLKVTANGTTTSPVVRGAWVMERILGRKPPPPPASVPAIEPDTRGAATIRQQLEKHRTLESCASCHAKIDPPGFALESFDVLGGFRERYRAIDGKTPEVGIGKNGQAFAFHNALPVEAFGELDGRKFKDIREFKRLVAADERQLARNLVGQLTVYATGAAVGFSDRAQVEAILDGAQKGRYGVRDLVHGLVSSPLFLNK
jgi:mono/diheme cytochrome c family protein